MTSQSFDPNRPWQDQIDRDTVETLLQQWLPEALTQYGFDALWTPKRLIERFAEGKISRDTTLQVLARYPYLLIPPTPEEETFADVPEEGSFDDVVEASMWGPIDDAFYAEVFYLKNPPSTNSQEGGRS